MKPKAPNVSVAKMKAEPAKPVSPKTKAPKLSAYELERQKNIEERQKMFEMLQLGDAKKMLAEVISGPVKGKALGRSTKRKAEDENRYRHVYLFLDLHF